MSRTAYRIVAGDESGVHDEPHVDGRRLTVRFVRDRVDGRGFDPGTVDSRHDLDVADVYQVLAYYHDHTEEVAEAERRRRETVARHEADMVAPGDVGQ
ncbi:DUF433 domain-containing protein [Halobacteriales archaeon QH_7_69_31]|nr:MAG: DUF433 domain-containing protein [Halobacteriales archaeon QH_7_69_31]